MSAPAIQRVVVDVEERSSGWFAHATIPDSEAVEVHHRDRETAIRLCAEEVRATPGGPRTIALPFCHPAWALAWWETPRYLQRTPAETRMESADPPAIPAAVRETDDGPMPVDVSERMEVGP